jgi:hypothetical protein
VFLAKTGRGPTYPPRRFYEFSGFGAGISGKLLLWLAPVLLAMGAQDRQNPALGLIALVILIG